MEKESASGASVRAFVTKNEDFCSINQCASISSKFISDDLDYSIHCHLWKDPSSLEDLMFVKFFFNLNIESQSSTIPEQTHFSYCDPIPLPTNSSKTYAVSMDPSDGKFYGYHKSGSTWIKGGILEFEYSSTNLQASDLKYGDRGAIETAGETITLPEGITYTTVNYYPSYDVYLWAVRLPDLHPTHLLVDKWWNIFVNIGANQSGYKNDFIKVANHFKYGQGLPFGFDCNAEVSTGVKFHENMRENLLLELDTLFINWLETHDNLEGLFQQTGVNSSLSLNPPYPYFGFPAWVRAIIGGQQGVGIKVKNFEKRSDCYFIEYIFTVLDTYGVGDDDAEDGPPSQQVAPFLRPGLKAMWVLQHYRNWDTSYCPNNLICFQPIPKLYFTFWNSTTICP